MARQDLKPRSRFDSKGRVTIPQWVREQIGVKKGSIVEIEVYGEKADKIILTVLRK